MLRRLPRLASRIIRRERGYAALNVAGLAVGLACCALILLYVRDETSYDRFHADADRTVRFVEDYATEASVAHLATTPAPLAGVLRESVPEVETVVRVYPVEQLVSATPDRRFDEPGFAYADSAFFDVFSFAFVEGDRATALDAPMSLVLTETTAARYFGAASPLGERLTVRNEEEAFDFTVTGIIEDLPTTTHLDLSMVASLSSLDTTLPWYDNWWYPQMYTYGVLQEGATTDGLAERIAERVAAGPHGHRYDDAAPAFTIQPLTDIHLHSSRESEIAPTSNAAYVSLFTLIAFGVLGIACINFMNLTTARATRRAREVGVRKAVGAERGTLAAQFLGESLAMTAVAATASVGLVALALPALNDVTGKALRLAVSPSDGALFAGIVLATGLLAGSYPALVLSGYQPSRVLRGASGGAPSGALLRRGLTAAQFALSIALVVGSLAVYRQLELLREDRLGFDKEHVVVVPLRDQASQQDHATIEAAWADLPGVQSVTSSSGVPGMDDGFSTFEIMPEDAAVDQLELMVLTVGSDFVETLGLEVTEGRDFDEAFGADEASGFVVNEAAARALGWDQPVGERLTLEYHLDRPVEKPGEVIGVVADFQYQSLREAPRPVLLHMLPGTYYNDVVSVRLAAGDPRATLAAMERAWAAFDPERPFAYTFLDAQVDALYRSEARLGTITAVFTLLAVLVACLGLLGLAAHAAESRRKEIGVRKVLGASTSRVMRLLVFDVLRPVLVAAVLAVPLSALVLDRWLSGFAERVALGPDLFALAVGLGLFVAVATVAGHALRAASADPIRALRTE